MCVTVSECKVDGKPSSMVSVTASALPSILIRISDV